MKLDALGIEGAREAVRATVEADPYDAIKHDLAEAGKRKARAEGVAESMKHMRKVVLSRIVGEIAQVHKNLSETKLERMARADPRYETHIKGLAEAITEKEDANTVYWRIQAELDWMDRTLMAAMSLAKLER